jgi:predicted AAA+ superfamily ATPase
MAISWDTLNQKKKPKPPCILLYGPEKAGKTTLASEFPGAVYLQAEEGDGVLDIQSLGKIESYAELMDAIGMLYNNEHEFQTVVLDSITALQPLVWAETGARGDDKGAKKERIEDFGYG